MTATTTRKESHTSKLTPIALPAAVKPLKILVVLAVALALAGTAAAGNRPHPKLDAIASEASGLSLSVWCEADEYGWFVGLRVPTNVNGFMSFARPGWVFISPKQCERLWFALDAGYKEAGLIPTASALLTLLHEAAHWRGLTDEGVTDCTALPMVVPMLEKYFGLAREVPGTTTRQVVRTERRKIAGKWRTFRYTTSIQESVMVANPDYERAAAWALASHKSKPAAYQGNC